jgi:hypothetical protein
VAHSYFDMNKYYSVHRTWFLLHVYFIPNMESEKFQRGYFEFYDFKKKKWMYLNNNCRKFYDYGAKPNFRGRFMKKFVVDRAAYLEKKSKIEEEEQGMNDRDFAEECLRRGMPILELTKYVSYSDRHLHRIKLEVTA